jgi:Uma2 family endonuclease
MADNTLQFKWIVVIKEGLEAVFRRVADVFVAGDLLWYPVEGEPTIRSAPDVMVVFGRPKGERGSYQQWLEDGIAPQVVFEILSPGNRFGKMLEKFQFYERYGVEEYYLYDPDDGSLDGWRREAGRLQKIPAMAGFRSPRLGIRFEPGEGPNSLIIVGPDGKRFLTHVELVERLEFADQLVQAERQRTEEQAQLVQAERQRAEEQAQRAEAERQRADRLAARLRELGVEPD